MARPHIDMNRRKDEWRLEAGTVLGMRRGSAAVLWIFLLFVAVGAGFAQSANPVLALRITCDPVAAGGWAQIKIYAAPPQQITTANLSMDLDPSFFGGISSVAAFSATGDAAGYAHVNGNHVDAHFSSGAGAIGQLPGLPVFAISVPVLSGLTRNATAALTLDTTNSSFNDPRGNSYSITVAAASAQTGGTISVQSVFPAGGAVPAGGVIQINGAGFDPSTTVLIDGVSIASTQVVSSRQIDITLAGATEMTGKCLRLANPARDRIEFFAAMPSAPAAGPTTTQPLLPLSTYQLVQWTYPIAHPIISQYFALQNPSTAPVTATFFNAVLCPLGTYTIPPGALAIADYNSARRSSGSCTGGNGTYGGLAALYMIASAPIRMLAYQYTPQNCASCTVSESTFPPIAMTGLPAPTNFFTVVPFDWKYQIGQPAPSPLGLGINSNIKVSVSVSSSASQWLAASVLQEASGNPSVRLTPNVTSLAPGIYTGTFTVTVTAALPPYLSQYSPAPSTYPVTLIVSASPLVTFAATGPGASIQWWETADPGYSGSYPTSVPVQSTSDPAPFTATATTTTGGNWLLVTPSKGITPASITVDVKKEGLAPGIYAGQITVQGPANSVSFSAYLNLPPATALSFVLEPGASTPATAPQSVYFSGSLGTLATVSVQTQSGGNWLAASLIAYESAVFVSATAARLGPGTYQGTVTVNGSKTSAQIPVTLTVLAPPTDPLTVTPASLSLTAAPGQAATQSFTVNSPGGAAVFGLNARIYPLPAFGAGTNPLTSLAITSTSVAVPSTPSFSANPGAEEFNPSPVKVAPAIYQFQASAAQPGTYYGSMVITWDGGSLTVPITLNVTAAPGFPPMMANVVNAASQAPTALAPGEIISIFGTGLGGQPTSFMLDAKANLPTIINGAQVLINGQAAPLLYVSASQINAIVPFEVRESGTATIQVVSNGLQSLGWAMPAASAAAGIFAIGSGVGQAAAVNQDNSLNGASDPAMVGTVIQIYATGGGQTAPPSITGTLSEDSPIPTVLPVTASIGGVDAPVTYHGSAPGEIAGLLQVNAIVPPVANMGSALPVLITVGGSQSQRGVTIAIK